MAKIPFTHWQANPLMKSCSTFISCCALLLSANLCQAEIAPEAATGNQENPSVFSRNHMVVTANTYATNAAIDILNLGGSAVDAAIAAQLVLGLVEPQSSGIGGGGFLMHWQKEGAILTSYDGRETAPASVDENHFIEKKNPDKPKFRAKKNPIFEISFGCFPWADRYIL